MSERVQCREPKSGSKYLDRPVVDEKAVQLGERLAGSVGVVEGDVGNATAHTAGPIRQLNPLDLSDSCLEVFLCEAGKSWLAKCE